MKKRLTAIAVCALMAFSILGCSSNNSNEPNYADDEAMQILSDGWQKRSDALEGADPSSDEYAAMLRQSVQVELDTDSVLKDRQFESTELQADVLAYINLLNDQLDVLKNYPINDDDFYKKMGGSL